jgi:formamidopyrimidine-DNA glycosylase
VEIKLDNDVRLLLHLRMTGKMLWQSASRELQPHTRFIISFSHGRLLCIDTRRFATLVLTADGSSQAFVKDPLLDFRTEELHKIARAKRLPVKSFLMDQRLIAGIGNIYACEILHHAFIDPRRPSENLSHNEWRKVEKAAAVILQRAVACRGTTVSDWRDLFGVSGENQEHLNVYSREGETCRRCSETIVYAKLGGRGTWFCPACQK